MTNSNGCWIAYAALNPNKIFHVQPCGYWTRFARQTIFSLYRNNGLRRTNGDCPQTSHHKMTISDLHRSCEPNCCWPVASEGEHEGEGFIVQQVYGTRRRRSQSGRPYS